jgi:hypothetical protein
MPLELLLDKINGCVLEFGSEVLNISICHMVNSKRMLWFLVLG